MSGTNPKSIASSRLDKLAITFSGVCLLHCLLAPLVVTLLPIFSLSAMIEEIVFHQLILLIVVPCSLFALIIGCRRHRQRGILLTGFLGLAALIFAATLGHEWYGHSVEKWITVAAGLILAYSHYLNYTSCQSDSCHH